MSTTAGGEVAGVLDPTVRDRVRRNRAVLVVAAVVVVVSALLAWAAAGSRTGYLDPDAADPAGARALAQLLREQGVDVVVVRRADEVAAAVAFLMSDDAAYITRQVLGVNGGIV